ncbi:single-stranded DNA-binding protein [Selenomonas sp.]|jgi:single-strand binding protein|uniref:single-stranded DNA-binding protein n=1 Tax=Selenomonas sp. TaxID=2053611 RepID=UPI001CB1A356|nr:single-stranded DNA-binding protein [Selenomonas sp.]MBF1688677.1 single-stranded DNA-binding protein [Selenomonas sp.]MBF1694250.1 single-stranded DNA-binding protein [Selenomonas sp.]MBF1706190.1 single-stranded DNA-binding protein [Selenomonas sp.]
MNRVILIGRLARDPEIRYTQSGKAFCRFTVAVDRRFSRAAQQEGQQTADFIPVTCWEKLAEICGNNLTKGRRIGVEGRIQVRSYDGSDGQRKYATDVVADNVEFLDSKNAGSAQGGYDASAPRSAAPAAGGGAAPDMMGPVIPDDDIPF